VRAFLDSRFRGNDGKRAKFALRVIPAKAEIQADAYARGKHMCYALADVICSALTGHEGNFIKLYSNNLIFYRLLFTRSSWKYKYVSSVSCLRMNKMVENGSRMPHKHEQLRISSISQLLREIDKGANQLDRSEYLELDASGLKRHAEEVKTRGRHRLMSEAETNLTSAISKVFE